MQYAFGEPARLIYELRDSDGQLIDAAAVTVTVAAPDGTTAGPYTLAAGQVLHDSTGRWHYDYTTPAAGVGFVARWTTSSPTSAAEAGFDVLAAYAAGGTDWTPSVDDVAALIPQRTLTAAGDAVGTFTAATIPSDAQVVSVVQTVANDISSATGPIPPVLLDTARSTATLGAAALVELGFFDDDNGRRYDELQKRYETSLERLIKAVASVLEEGSVEPEDQRPLPSGAFPLVDVGVYNRPPPVTTLGTAF